MMRSMDLCRAKAKKESSHQSEEHGSSRDGGGGEEEVLGVKPTNDQAAKTRNVLLSGKLSLMASSKASSNEKQLVESTKLKQAVIFDCPGVDLLVKKPQEIDQLQNQSINGKDTSKLPKKKKKSAKQRVPRARKPKDMPRRPLSAYNIFFKSERAKMLEKPAEPRPNGENLPSSGKIGFEMLAKTVGRKWRELPGDELSKYAVEAKEDMHRYKREMEEYHQNLAKKRSGLIPATLAPWEQQDQSTLALSATTPMRTTSAESAQYLASLANESMIRRTGESSMESSSRARGLFDHSNYIMANVLAASARRSQHGLPNIDQEQQQSNLFGLQELANLRRQELFLQHVAASDHRAGAMSGSLSSSGPMTSSSRLYEHHLANELRSQHVLSGGGGLGHQSMGNYAAQQYLGGLSAQQSQAQSTLEQLLLQQQQQQTMQLAAANFMQPGMRDEAPYQNLNSTTAVGMQQRILAAQQVAALGRSGGGGLNRNDLLALIDRIRATERDNTQRQNYDEDDYTPPGG